MFSHMDTVEDKVKHLVAKYKKEKPDEFKAFSKMLTKKRRDLKTKTGRVAGSSTLNRQIIETPETLYDMFKEELLQKEYNYIYSVGDPKLKGIKWFAKTFPEFSIAGKPKKKICK